MRESQEKAGPWHLSRDLHTNLLEDIQVELDTVNARVDRDFKHLQQ